MFKPASTVKSTLFSTSAALIVGALLSVISPSTASAKDVCQCSITCSNGTSCSAKGGSCSCTCGWWSGDATCSGGSSNVRTPTSDQIQTLIAKHAWEFCDTVLTQADNDDTMLIVGELVLQAEDALVSADAEGYYDALAKLDVAMLELSTADREIIFYMIDSLVAP